MSNEVKPNDGIDMEEAGRQLYGGTMFADSVLHDESANLTMPLNSLREANEQWRDSMWSARLNPPDAKAITDLVRQHLSQPASAEQQATWLKETSSEFTNRYGAESARERVGLATQLSHKSRGLRAAIEKAGIANHPTVIRVLAEGAWTLRTQGKL